jgi:uncharacterized protein DUF6174
MSRSAVCLSFSSLLAACSLLTGPSAGDRLDEARARWARVGPINYEYEVRWVCFCGGPVGRWIAVSVRDDLVTRARYVDTGLDVESESFSEIPTIPGLFDQVANIIENDPYQLEVQYDPDDGHPIMLTVDRIQNAVDDEYSFQSRNLQGIADLLERAR